MNSRAFSDFEERDGLLVPVDKREQERAERRQKIEERVMWALDAYDRAYGAVNNAALPERTNALGSRIVVEMMRQDAVLNP